jgi:hypothetical protein
MQKTVAATRYQGTRFTINTLRLNKELLAFQQQQQKRMDRDADECFAIGIDNERSG